MTTIDEHIAALIGIREKSKLKGDTIIVVCEAEREYLNIRDVILDQDEDGAVCLIKI